MRRPVGSAADLNTDSLAQALWSSQECHAKDGDARRRGDFFG